MAKKENALATVDESKYPALTSGSRTVEIMRENLGGEVSPEDLTMIKWPAGGSTIWTIPTADGQETTPLLEGVIVHMRPRRGFWDVGSDGFPDCRSNDARTGEGTPGGDCTKCPKSKFGTKIEKDGSIGKGQACNLRKLVFLVRPGDMLPVCVSMPSKSLGPMKSWLMTVSNKGMPYYSFVTRLELSEAGQGQEKYAVIKPSVGPMLSEEAAKKIMEYSQTLQEVFANVEVDGGGEGSHENEEV